MTYIHEHATWPEFEWDNNQLVDSLGSVRQKQGRLLGKISALGFELASEAGLETLTNDVIKTSAIEGERLDPAEVRSSIARRLGIEVAGYTKPNRDVEGIVEILLDATRHSETKLTKKRLCDWHAALFPTGRNALSRIVVGKWRPKEAGPMQVVSGAFGREKIHFVAPAAEGLEAEMKMFLAWFNKPLSIDPIIKAGIAHFWFVTIHPFEDGNGRIARALADMALARADGIKERFYSMSSQIEAERKAYYQNLELTQRGDRDITRWLKWFIGCLGRALDGADLELAAVLNKAKLWQQINRRPVNERQRLVINRMLSDFQGFLNTSKYAKLAKCSPDTALRDIRELLERGILLQNSSGGRSTSYRLAAPENVVD